MARRKYARIGGYKPLPTLDFTQIQLEVVKKGLLIFSEALQRNKMDSPNLSLARLGYVTVLNKVTRMLSDGSVVRFDYNELLILSACLDMVLVDAAFMAIPNDFTIAVSLNGKIKERLSPTYLSFITTKVKAP